MALDVVKTGVSPDEYEPASTLSAVVAAVKALDGDPIEVLGARSDGTALAALLTALATKGLIIDSTTAS